MRLLLTLANSYTIHNQIVTGIDINIHLFYGL